MKEENSAFRKGALLFALIFLAISLFLLSQLGAETKFSSRGKLFAQPAFWPAVGVIGMTLFGAAHVALNWRGAKWRTEGAEVLIWFRPLEYLAYFMVYVFATPTIGYLPASIIFTGFLAVRVGYRSAKMIGLAACVGALIVIIFKTFLSVKIPGGAFYDYLPDSIRLFAIVNF